MARYPLSLPNQLKQDAETLAASQGISLNQFVLWAVAEKVGDLRSQLSDPTFLRITYRRGASGQPRPVLRGTNLRVQTIAVASTHWGLSSAQIADEYGISRMLVEEALMFYQNHRAEIDAAIAAEEALEPADV
ncbi:MAG TPA: DUF433 domain-containing protein [Anaerolineae bacterium]|nr:DUF433 domain-containing protein [Anaerolineae bacterium]